MNKGFSKAQSKSMQDGSGCLFLFGAIFLAVGLFVGGMQVMTVSKSLIAKSWAETDAVVLSANLDRSYSDGDYTYRAMGRYRYEWEGRSYESDRLFFQPGHDSFDKFHRKIVGQMKSKKSNNRPLVVRVNPSRPDQAVAFPAIRWGMMGFMSMFSIIFGGVGAGIIAGAIYGKKASKRETKRQIQFPEQPWLWSDLWQTPEVKNNSKMMVIMAGIFALIWNAISWPAAFLITDAIREEGVWWIALFYSFPIIGLFAVHLFWKSYRQWKRYGRSSFVLDTYPAALGHSLMGHLKMRTVPHMDSRFNIKLSCIREETRGSGEDRKTVEVVLWQDEQTIPASAGRFMGSFELPVKFGIPGGERQSSTYLDEKKIFWRLSAESEQGAVDFEQRFEVPVFDPEVYRISIPFSARVSEEDAQRSVPEYQGDWEKTGVVFWDEGGANYYYFPPGRHKGMAMILSFMTLIFCGVGIAPFFSPVPLLFGIVFGIVGALLGLWALHMWLFKSAVDVQPGKLTVRRGLFSGKFTDLPMTDIQSFKVVSNMSAGEVIYYDIVAVLKSGTKLKLADHLLGKRDVENLVARIKGDLGFTAA